MLVLVALSLVLLMGVAGLAIDLSHAEVNKTRQQNLADALALSAAISLNKGDNPSAAEAYARANTLALFKNSPGNAEINTAIASGLDFAFSFTNINDLNASTAGNWKSAGDAFWDTLTNKAHFVRVTSLNTPMNISTWFAAVIGFNNMAVSNSAVAGFTPITPCDLAPIMMCTENPASPDIDCKDGSCYGYTIKNIYCLTSSTSNGSGGKDQCAATSSSILGAGNIGLLNIANAFPDSGLNNGAATVKKCLAGDPICQNLCLLDDPSTVPTKTGADWGPVREGIDSIFDQDHPELGFPSDTITGLGQTTPGSVSTADTYLNYNEINSHYLGTPTAPYLIPIGGIPYTDFNSTTFKNPYTEYKTFKGQKESGLNSDAKYGQRIISVPFVDCTDLKNGVDPSVPLKGYGCFFLTARAEKNAAEVFILGQFIEDQDLCQSTGNNTSTSDFGFDKVILYKDPFGGHS
ncbi:MAG: pilus assembly protein TadG-related protein [Methylococcaceae bacterium]